MMDGSAGPQLSDSCWPPPIPGSVSLELGLFSDVRRSFGWVVVSGISKVVFHGELKNRLPFQVESKENDQKRVGGLSHPESPGIQEHVADLILNHSVDSVSIGSCTGLQVADNKQEGLLREFASQRFE